MLAAYLRSAIWSAKVWLCGVYNRVYNRVRVCVCVCVCVVFVFVIVFVCQDN